MKQYKLTSADFVPQNDSGATDAYIDPDVLRSYQRGEEPSTKQAFKPGHLPNLGKFQADNNIKPGTDEWFKLWFSKPELTGEKPHGR